MTRIKKEVKRFRNELTHNLNLLTRPPEKFNFSKAFVIGMPKTGTSSVREFLKLNGLRHLTIFHRVTERWQVGDYGYLDRCLNHYNSFDDRPWNKIDVIRRTMKRDEDDRFILTTRDPNEWYDSRNRYYVKFGYEPVPESKRNQVIEEIFFPHYDNCRSLAHEFGKKLLEVDVTKDSGAGRKITDFLELDPHNFNFPHSNKTL